MIRNDGFELRFESWLDQAAAGATPPVLLEAVLTTTKLRRSRPGWVAALRGNGMGPRVRVAGRTVDLAGRRARRFAYALVLAALTLALVGALILAGTGRSRQGAIVFYRTDAQRTTNTGFKVNPDGSKEQGLANGTGVLSPDGTQLLVEVRVDDPAPLPGQETSWIRPAIAKADGSDPRLLDAYPGRRMHLAAVAWTPDGLRLLVSSGSEDVNPDDQGIYTVRASDGGDLKRIVAAPDRASDAVVGYSPDGMLILINRIGFDPSFLIARADGSGVRRLAPDGLFPVDLDFWDTISADWSPDGSQVVLAAYTDADARPALYVVAVAALGGPPRVLVPPTTGALSAQWSPRGDVIAFTNGRFGVGKTPAGKALLGPPQVWVVNADGSGLLQLTSGSDGSTSVTPVWSPDGSKLLFQRKLGDAVNLWTMNADGTNQVQLTATPVAADYVGGYAWTSPAPW